jgi:hypothetical protein
MLVDEVAVAVVVAEEARMLVDEVVVAVVVAEEEQKITMETSWKVVDTNTDVDSDVGCLHLDCCFHSNCCCD